MEQKTNKNVGQIAQIKYGILEFIYIPIHNA